MALYQTYRPATFDQVIGQDHITRTLQNLIKSNNVSHAYLFFGPQGTGKTSVARLFARAINCIGETKPCGVCENCKAMLGGALDLIELDAATHSGVDTVRTTIRDAAHFQPTMVPYKVYIIDEVHGLSRQAFDALLKILEEPPKHLIFILATTEFDKVPKTVVSRCQLHSFHRVSTTSIFDLLVQISTKEGFTYEDEGLRIISRYANGCVRDAISLLDQVSAYDVTSEWVRNILGLGKEGDAIRFLRSAEEGAGNMLAVLDEVLFQGISPILFLDQVASVLQSLLRAHLGSLYDVSEAVMTFCNQTNISANDSVMMLESILSAKRDMKLMDPFTAIAMHLFPISSPQTENSVENSAKNPPQPREDPIVKELQDMGFDFIFTSQL